MKKTLHKTKQEKFFFIKTYALYQKSFIKWHSVLVFLPTVQIFSYVCCHLFHISTKKCTNIKVKSCSNYMAWWCKDRKEEKKKCCTHTIIKKVIIFLWFCTTRAHFCISSINSLLLFIPKPQNLSIKNCVYVKELFGFNFSMFPSLYSFGTLYRLWFQ